jgi:hypothetical protein
MPDNRRTIVGDEANRDTPDLLGQSRRVPGQQSQTSPVIRKFTDCLSLGHSYVIPRCLRRSNFVYCRRCGYQPVPK